MANCSSAFGTLTIKADEETRKNLASMIREQLEGADYFTSLNSIVYVIEDSICYTFTGCGRWAYSVNCERLFEWLNPMTDYELLADEYKEKQKKLVPLWEKIKASDWKIEFAFVDEEQGLRVLYTEDSYVEHKANQDCAKYHVNNRSHHDYTPEELVNLSVFDDIEEAKEYMQGEDYEDYI